MVAGRRFGERKWGWTSTQLMLNGEPDNLGRLLPVAEGGQDGGIIPARLAFVSRAGVAGDRKGEICFRF